VSICTGIARGLLLRCHTSRSSDVRPRCGEAAQGREEIAAACEGRVGAIPLWRDGTIFAALTHGDGLL